MSFEPNTWKPKDKVTSAHLNRIEQGIAALYPQETIIAPEQTVTITAETDEMTGEPITLAEGYTLPETLPDNWVVTIDSHVLPYNDSGEEGEYRIENEQFVGIVFAQDGGLHLIMTSMGENPPSSAGPMIGDHTVKITQTEVANPTVKAFPVSAGRGTTRWLIEAPAEEVDAAMVAGCVLLYAADPDPSTGFAFGCLVGSVMYYASFGEEFAWHTDTVTLRDGKYIVRDLG